MKKSILLFSLFLGLALVMSSCTTKPYQTKSHKYSAYTIRGNLVTAGYTIADTLVSNLQDPIDQNSTILVASLVNVDNLEESSTLGRMLSEQISSRFSQMGYKVKELKLRKKSIYMEKEKGEFLLSRDMHEVTNRYQAAAIVIGTYGKASNSVYLSAKIVNPNNNLLISSCDFRYPVSWREKLNLM